MEELTIVKVGGKVIEDKDHFQIFIDQFKNIPGKKILVHGGGVLADKVLEERGVIPKMINGRRITDSITLETVVMVYGGMINKKIMAKLIGYGIKAIGITGADGLLVESVKRPSTPIDYGLAGDVVKVNTLLAEALIDVNIVPVVGPLSITTEGQILNTNADTIATQIAIALSKKYAVNIVYSFDVKGVMKDVNDPDSLIHQLDRDTYEECRENKVIHSGMIPKLDNAFSAVLYTKRTILTHFENVLSALQKNTTDYTEVIDG